MPSHLLGLSDIARLIGVTRQRVHQLAEDDPSFPQPVAIASGGRVWERADIERWARETGRLK